MICPTCGYEEGFRLGFDLPEKALGWGEFTCTECDALLGIAVIEPAEPEPWWKRVLGFFMTGPWPHPMATWHAKLVIWMVALSQSLCTLTVLWQHHWLLTFGFFLDCIAYWSVIKRGYRFGPDTLVLTLVAVGIILGWIFT